MKWKPENCTCDTEEEEGKKRASTRKKTVCICDFSLPFFFLLLSLVLLFFAIWLMLTRQSVRPVRAEVTVYDCMVYITYTCVCVNCMQRTCAFSLPFRWVRQSNEIFFALVCVFGPRLLWLYMDKKTYIRLSALFSDGGNGEVEKAPFLAKPVQLTPAWEANNLPNDELNFRGKHGVCHLWWDDDSAKVDRSSIH